MAWVGFDIEMMIVLLKMGEQAGVVSPSRLILYAVDLPAIIFFGEGCLHVYPDAFLYLAIYLLLKIPYLSGYLM